MKNQLLIESSKNALAALAGALLTLACAPFFIFPLAVISAGILLVLWLDVSRKTAFMRGFFYGVGLFTSGVYWVYISMHSIAMIPAPAAAFLTAIFISFLSLYPAFQGWVLNTVFPKTNSTKILCAFPALWVLIEWIRSWLCSGFPWLFIGYSQTHSPLKGFAPIASVYAVSLATVLSAAFIVNAFRLYRQKRLGISALNLLGLAAIWIAGGILTYIPWTHPIGKSFQVSMVQANIPQTLKWEPELVIPTLLEYKNLSEDHWDSQVVIWPESAIPAPLNEVMGFVDEMSDTAKKHHSQLITGIPIKTQDSNRYFNAVVSVGQSGEGFYLKHRLVPFGEFIPLQSILGPIFDILHVPMSDFAADTHFPNPIVVHDHIRMLTFICYEIAYPEYALHTLHEVELLLTVTNDAWYGHSIAQAQHLQMAQMRAIENGRPVLFASNDGITAIISHQGNILAEAPPYTTYVLTGQVQPYTGKTPWQRYAMDPLLAILLMLLFTAYKYRKA